MVDPTMLQKIMYEYHVNEEQASALDVDKSIALHAGAGSGKTYVLTRRYLRLLLDKEADIDSIVAITFTNKAALEMKDRIRLLVDEFIKNTGDLKKKERLYKIKENLEYANISTFHSFCDKILKENCYILRLTSSYEIIDQTTADTLIDQILDELLNEYYLNMAYLDVFRDINSLKQDYIFNDEFCSDIKRIYKKIRERIENINVIYENTKSFINQKAGEDSEYINKYARVLDLLTQIIVELDKRYSQKKLEENVIDFNDLEIYTMKILEHNKIRESYQNRFRYFLVDEFQDTNDVQLKILLRLVEDHDGRIENGKLFVVGDVKQSIYAFRGANYKVFNEITEIIEKNGGLKKDLTVCRRSHPMIIKTINDIFGNVLSQYYVPLKPSLDGMKIFKKAAFMPQIILKQKTNSNGEKSSKDDFKEKIKKLKEKNISLNEMKEMFEYLQEDDKSNDNVDDSLVLIEGIKNLLANGYEYKDIAILLRTRHKLSDYEQALKNEDIPYTVIGGIGYFQKQEVIDLINLFKFAYSQNDYIALIGVLRAPFVGVPDHMLFDLINSIKEGTIFSEAAKSIEDKTLKYKLMELDFLRGISQYVGVHEYLINAIERLRIKEILLGLENGEQMLRNVEKFLEIAKEFENKGIFHPYHFIEYIENLKENSNIEGEAFLDTENADAVKIMTIHAAKGLEFKAVFVPNLEVAAVRENKSKIYYHSNSGILVVDFEEQPEAIANAFEHFSKQKEDEEKEEAKRILYVAATRAESFLSFSGVEKSASSKRKDSYLNIFQESSISLNDFSFSEMDEGFQKINENINEKMIGIQDLYDNVNVLCGVNKGSIFSISRLLTFKQCPKKYYLKYIAKIGNEFKDTFSDEKEDILEDKYSASQRGIDVHAAIEKITTKGFYDIPSKIARYINAFQDIEKEYEKVTQGTRIKKFTEYEILFKLNSHPNIMIFGILDRADIFEWDGKKIIYLIDYKTNKINEINHVERLKEYYKPQFTAYSMAISKAFSKVYGDIEIGGSFMYLLDNATLQKIEITEEDKHNLVQEFINLYCVTNSKNNFEEYQENLESCANCGYKLICRGISQEQQI